MSVNAKVVFSEDIYKLLFLSHALNKPFQLADLAAYNMLVALAQGYGEDTELYEARYKIIESHPFYSLLDKEISGSCLSFVEGSMGKTDNPNHIAEFAHKAGWSDEAVSWISSIVWG